MNLLGILNECLDLLKEQGTAGHQCSDHCRYHENKNYELYTKLKEAMEGKGIITWPYLAEICLYRSTRMGNDAAGLCGHGANGELYRCCRLMCPAWDDLTGDPDGPMNQVVDQEELKPGDVLYLTDGRKGVAVKPSSSEVINVGMEEEDE